MGLAHSIKNKDIESIHVNYPKTGKGDTVIVLSEHLSSKNNLEEILRKIQTSFSKNNQKSLHYFSMVLDPVGDNHQIETSIPMKDMLGILLTEGLINEQEMLDAYKSLDLGKDNNFLSQYGSPTKGGWTSYLS